MTIAQQLHNSATHAKGKDSACPVCAPRITVSGVCYDAAVNKTFGAVRHPQFSATFYVSGKVSEREFAALVQPVADRLAEVN
jgi:hypothetical protein